MGFLQLLPVNALGRDECPSPYSAISSIALEPLYLSLEPWTVPGLEERVFNETEDTPPWEQPSGPDLVDYPKVRSWKMWNLRGAWHNFRTKPEYAGIMPKFREWVKEQGSWLEDFVCFQVLCDLFGTAIWWHWPEQDPARSQGHCLRLRGREGFLPLASMALREAVGIHPNLCGRTQREADGGYSHRRFPVQFRRFL